MKSVAMVIAVPLLGGRVAPRCTSGNRVLLVAREHGAVITRQVVREPLASAADLLALLAAHSVDILVCGGITGETRELIELQGVTVVANVAGSVEELVAVLQRDELPVGFAQMPPPEVGALGFAALDCLACVERFCEEDAIVCPRLPTGLSPPVPLRVAVWLQRAEAPACHSEVHDPCRLVELITFARAAGVGTLGLPFCREVREVAARAAEVLRECFRVVPVSCAISAGCRQDAELCSPLVQAHVLNLADTDLNLSVGLCGGADCVLAAASRAPVTTLITREGALRMGRNQRLFTKECVRRSRAVARRTAASSSFPRR